MNLWRSLIRIHDVDKVSVHESFTEKLISSSSALGPALRHFYALLEYFLVECNKPQLPMSYCFNYASAKSSFTKLSHERKLS